LIYAIHVYFAGRRDATEMILEDSSESSPKED
jgi:hypothetical protein